MRKLVANAVKTRTGPVYRARIGSVSVPVYAQATRSGVAFVVTWKADGMRKRRSKADLREAKDEALRVAESLAALGDASRAVSGDELAALRRCVAMLDGTGVHIEAAVREYVEASRLLGDVSVMEAARIVAKSHTVRLQDDGRTVADAVAAFLTQKRSEGRSRVYLHDLEIRLGRLTERFHGSVRSLHWPDVEEWVRRLKRADGAALSGRSRNNYLAGAEAFVRWCIRQRWIAAEAAPARRDRYSVDPGEIAIFTPDELQKLLEHARGQTRAVVALGGLAGIRTSEIQRLKWGQVRFETDAHFPHGWIELNAGQTKNRRKLGARARRLIPMGPRLRALLQEISGNPDALICPAKHPTDILPRLGRRAGVPWRKNGLRHSFGSYRMAQIADAARVSAEMGNSPEEVFASYRRVVTPAVAARWFSLAD